MDECVLRCWHPVCMMPSTGDMFCLDFVLRLLIHLGSRTYHVHFFSLTKHYIRALDVLLLAHVSSESQKKQYSAHITKHNLSLCGWIFYDNPVLSSLTPLLLTTAESNNWSLMRSHWLDRSGNLAKLLRLACTALQTFDSFDLECVFSTGFPRGRGADRFLWGKTSKGCQKRKE